MKRRVILGFLGLTGLVGSSAILIAQRPRASAHETVSLVVNGKKIAIEYGRPAKKGRQIFGDLVPYGQVWRTGADEATVLSTEADIMLGPLHVPAGSYSLFTIPGQKEWTLVVNKVAKQWGAFKYDEKSDFGRTPMKVGTGPATEVFTISLTKSGDHGAELKMAWDTVTASVPIMVH